MAEVREVILRVSTDGEGARKSLAQLTDELKQAEGAAKSARVGSEEYVKALGRVGDLRVTIREVGKELKGAGAEGVKALGGINENAQFAEKSLGELLQLQKQLNKEALNLKPGTDEFKKFAEVSAQVNGRVREVREQLTGVPSLTKQLSTGFGAFGKAGEGATKALKGIGLAISAIPILRLVELLFKGIDALKEFEFIEDILERVGAAVQAVFGQVAVAFEAIVNLDFGKAFEALTTGLVKQVKAVDALTLARQSLDDEIAIAAIRESALNKEVAISIAQSRDKTKSDEVRLAALAKYYAMKMGTLSKSLRPKISLGKTT